jgi:D-inositol-3-phosphate glycosyltransferase
MKIAIIGPSHPYRGGIAAFNERLALELQKSGHDVTIFTFTRQYPDFLFPGKTQYSDEAQPQDLNIIRCINSLNPFNWISIGNQIKTERPDLVIVKFWLPFMGPCFGMILRNIKKNRHSIVIANIDNIIPHESRIGDRVFTRYFVKPINGFALMSQNVINDLEQFDKTKPKILTPHPIYDSYGEIISREEALAKIGLDISYRYILFFGLVRKYKGLDLLIEAFADNRFRGSKIKLIIAGEYYSDKEDYNNLINKFGLEDDIHQVDKFIPDSEVNYYFNACDLVVQPYKSATQSGITQIAYHFNKPMVVTKVGGLEEMCPDGKVGYVVPTNSNDIANAIFKFFEQTNHKEMIDNIIKEKKKYSWEIFVQNIFVLFDKIKKTRVNLENKME